MSLRVPSIRPDDYDPLAALCKAAGDSLRLNVLRALANDSFGVLELAQIFAIGQSGMSHHLKVLAQAGLVATRREGNAIFYRRSLPWPNAPAARCTRRCWRKWTNGRYPTTCGRGSMPCTPSARRSARTSSPARRTSSRPSRT